MHSRYNKLNEYYKEKFGERTLKICVDGGFTCPNRDGTCGIGGCIFCSEKGSGELIKKNNESITKQVKSYLNSYRAKRANKFIVYYLLRYELWPTSFLYIFKIFQIHMIQ